MIKNLLLAGCVCLGSFANAQQVPNGTLEAWTDSGFGYEDPDGFQTLNGFSILGAPVSVSKTTTSHQGTYAAEISSFSVDLGGGPQPFPGLMTLSADGSATGIPYTARPDSVVFWYKYAPVSGDMGSAVIQLTENGNDVANGAYAFTTAQATYKRAAVAFTYSSSATPDTLNIGFITSTGSTPQDGTMLTVDDIQIVFNTGAGLAEYVSVKQVSAFPNPANESVQVAIANGQALTVYSSTGSVIETLTAASNGQNTKINTGSYAEGVYMVKSEDGSVARVVVRH